MVEEVGATTYLQVELQANISHYHQHSFHHWYH